MAEKNGFDITKLVMKTCLSPWCSGQGVACTCRWTGFDYRQRYFLFSISLYRFFLFALLFLNTIFPFGLFSCILTADPAGHTLGSRYILSLSPEFYFGKGISKALDLHTGQAYDQIKTISCQDMSLLSISWIFFNVSWHDKHTQYTTNCTNLHPTPTSDPLAKVKLAFFTSS